MWCSGDETNPQTFNSFMSRNCSWLLWTKKVQTTWRKWMFERCSCTHLNTAGVTVGKECVLMLLCSENAPGNNRLWLPVTGLQWFMCFRFRVFFLQAFWVCAVPQKKGVCWRKVWKCWIGWVIQVWERRRTLRGRQQGVEGMQAITYTGQTLGRMLQRSEGQLKGQIIQEDTWSFCPE